MNARRAFFRSLKQDEAKGSKDPVSHSHAAIDFSLASVREFKGLNASAASFKVPREEPRKRPNYDNTRRRMYANPEIRTSHLV